MNKKEKALVELLLYRMISLNKKLELDSIKYLGYNNNIRKISNEFIDKIKDILVEVESK